jgi:hypothetical protein
MGFHFHQTIVSFVPGSLSPTTMPSESPNELASLPSEVSPILHLNVPALITILDHHKCSLPLPETRPSTPNYHLTRMYDLIIRVIHNRLPAAAPLAGHKVILECCHPHAKLNARHFFYECLGSDSFEGERNEPHDVDKVTKLSKLKGLCCHFRLIQPAGARMVWHPRLSGAERLLASA